MEHPRAQRSRDQTPAIRCGGPYWRKVQFPRARHSRDRIAELAIKGEGSEICARAFYWASQFNLKETHQGVADQATVEKKASPVAALSTPAKPSGRFIKPTIKAMKLRVSLI